MNDDMFGMTLLINSVNSARRMGGVFAFFFLQVFTRFEDCSLTSNYWRTGVGVKDKSEPSIRQPSTAWNRKE